MNCEYLQSDMVNLGYIVLDKEETGKKNRFVELVQESQISSS